MSGGPGPRAARAGTYASASGLAAQSMIGGMAYGHAERTLVTIRLLEAETRELLSHRERLTPEQAEWLRDTASSATRRLRRARVADAGHLPAVAG